MSEQSNRDSGLSEQDLEEVTLEEESIYQGEIIHVKRRKVRLSNGQEAMREVVLHPGAVAVAPLLPSGEVLLIRQYRSPLNQTLVEIPAGKLERGEDPLQCAHRELWEETGYRAESMRLLCQFYTSPGFADEKIYLYLAEALYVDGQGTKDPDELLQCFALPLEEALRWVEEGRIQDAKTAAALFALSHYRHQPRSI